MFHYIRLFLCYFNSRPHEEVDNRYIALRYMLFYFNSRPHEEVDLQGYITIIRQVYFNSRPHEEVDSYRPVNSKIYSISTHDLTKRSTIVAILAASFQIFQLTTSRRGRPNREIAVQYIFSISTHDLTKRSTCYVDSISQLRCISTHDLTKRSTVNLHILFLTFAFIISTLHK